MPATLSTEKCKRDRKQSVGDSAALGNERNGLAVHFFCFPLDLIGSCSAASSAGKFNLPINAAKMPALNGPSLFLEFRLQVLTSTKKCSCSRHKTAQHHTHVCLKSHPSLLTRDRNRNIPRRVLMPDALT
jgi:hypothetical protein